jgi:hypothetical protein
MSVDKNPPPSLKDLEDFLNQIDLDLPNSFIQFYKESNGADIFTEDDFILLYNLDDMAAINKKRKMEEYFIFGSNGSDTAYIIHRNTGFIYDVPFIGMSKEEARFLFKDFGDFKDSWK